MFVMSNKKSPYPVLQVDLRSIPSMSVTNNLFDSLGYQSLSLSLLFIFNLVFRGTSLTMLLLCRLISDLVVVIVSAAIGGIVFSCLGQPVCTLDFDCNFYFYFFRIVVFSTTFIFIDL